MGALARDAELLGDVRDRAMVLDHPPDQQGPAVDSQTRITVRHENLRRDVGLRQATPQPEVLLTSTASDCHQRPG